MIRLFKVVRLFEVVRLMSMDGKTDSAHVSQMLLREK